MKYAKKIIALFLAAVMMFSVTAVFAGAEEKKVSDYVLLSIETDKSSYEATDTAKVTVKVENATGQDIKGLVISAKSDNWLLAKGSSSNVIEIGDLANDASAELTFKTVVSYKANGIELFFDAIILFFMQLFSKPAAFDSYDGAGKSSTTASLSVNHGGADVNITATAWYDELSEIKRDPVKNGDVIEFGSYPQSEVTDASLISALNGQTLSWQSFGCYAGTGLWYDGEMEAKDYMKYADVVYGGDKYRAVTFSQFRPDFTGGKATANEDGKKKYEQENNGYETNKTYWFRFDPLKWIVLDEKTGLVLCDTVIDSQPFANTIIWNDRDKDSGFDTNEFYNESGEYASDWETSSLRAWLNDDFYNTAFSISRKVRIAVAANSGECWTTLNGNFKYEEYDSSKTYNKVFVPSWDEIINEKLGFNTEAFTTDEARLAKGSDYAKCRGLYVYDIEGVENSVYSGCSRWWLRTPSNGSFNACLVAYTGYGSYNSNVYDTSAGVRPAIMIADFNY